MEDQYLRFHCAGGSGRQRNLLIYVLAGQLRITPHVVRAKLAGGKVSVGCDDDEYHGWTRFVLWCGSVFRFCVRIGYSLKIGGGPLTRLPFRLMVTSTGSAIFMKGMPLFIPYSLRSNAIVPFSSPVPLPLSAVVKVTVSGFETPQCGRFISMHKVLAGLTGTSLARSGFFSLCFFCSRRY